MSRKAEIRHTLHRVKFFFRYGLSHDAKSVAKLVLQLASLPVGAAFMMKLLGVP